MPVLRSQRGAKSVQDAVPPLASSPPRSKSTRSKKASKQSVDDDADDKRSVGTASTSRSTKTRTRAKPTRYQEEAVESSPPQASARSTRSKPSKSTATTKKTRSTVRTPEKENTEVPNELNPVVCMTPLGKAKSKASSKATSKKGTSRVKKSKKPAPSTSTEVTDEEEEQDKKMTLDEVYRCHTDPLKIMMNMGVDAVPKILSSLRDTKERDKLDEEFKRLMSSKEMPPPLAPPPKTKGRGRQKRARSPEKIPEPVKKVPASFNFAGETSTEEHGPANKKLLMDHPTPESEELPEIKEEAGTSQSLTRTKGKKKKIEILSTPDEEEAPALVEKPKKVGKSRKKKIVEPESTDDDDDKGKGGKLGSDDSGKSKSKKKKMAEVSPPATSEEKMDMGEADQVQPPVAEKVSEIKKPEETKPATSKKASEIAKPIPEDVKPSTSKKISEVVASSKPEKAKEISVPETVVVEAEKPKVPEKAVEAEKPIAPEKVEKEKTPESAKSEANIANETITIEDSPIGPENPAEEVDGNKATVPLADQSCVLFETTLDLDDDMTGPKQNESVPETTPAKDEHPNIADETIIIKKYNPAEDVLAPESPEQTPEAKSTASAGGSSTKVSSLVNFFDKNRKEAEVQKKLSFSKASKLNETRCISPSVSTSEKKVSASKTDLNSTYVLPTAKQAASSSSAMNVTVCLTKSTVKPEEFLEESPKQVTKPTPIVPPANFLSTGRFMQDSPASRSFVKEPPALAMVIEEDDDKESVSSEKTEKVRPLPNAKPANKEKKNASTSSSGSCSSMKSATSNPCLSATKKLPSSALKTATVYGSTGKLNEVAKTKGEDAEKRRQELLQQKVEATRKKNEETQKKIEKKKAEEEKKRLEEERKLKEKQKAILQPATLTAKKVVSGMGAKPVIGAPGCPKPQFTLGPSSSKPTTTVLPPLSKNPFHKPAQVKAPQPPPEETDADESFKSTCSSFLDQTQDGHLSSYDITMYEDLDEDLKHRENKTIPTWASDKEALKAALFSMVLLEEYQHKLPGGFPKAERSYRLFPNKPY